MMNIFPSHCPDALLEKGKYGREHNLDRIHQNYYMRDDLKANFRCERGVESSRRGVQWGEHCGIADERVLSSACRDTYFTSPRPRAQV